jgi:hypothetical protein
MDLASHVRERNNDKLVDFVMKGAWGTLFTTVAFGLFFCAVWIFSLLFWGVKEPTNLALAITGVYLLVAFWSAWRRIEPFKALPRPTREEQVRARIEDIFGEGSLLVDGLKRESIAGYATVLLGGPKCFVEAIAAWNARIPADRDLVERAQALLDRACGGGLSTETVVDGDACRLLAQLGLVRSDAGKTVRLVATAKGKTLSPRATTAS